MCTIVKLNLTKNNLTGEFAPDFELDARPPDPTGTGRMLFEAPSPPTSAWQRTFHDLQDLHVDQNNLTGHVSQWIQQLDHLRSLRLQANLFVYEEPTQGASSLDKLYLRCAGIGANAIAACNGCASSR